jgi:hypothetical protein
MLLTSCGGSTLAPPIARLDAPECAVVGASVKLNASTSEAPEGDLVRYSFRIGHSGAWISSREPVIDFRFSKPETSGDELAQTLVVLEVLDDRGRKAQDAALVWVVFDESQCPEGTAPPLPGEDVTTWDVPSEVDGVDIVVPDGLADSTVPDGGDDVPFPEETISDVQIDAGPGCPSIDGAWHLEVFCGGSPKGELELNIMQNADCTFSDDLGVLTGTMSPDGGIELSSDIPQLFMGDCFGTLDAPEMFTVDCSSGCTVQFLKDLAGGE